MARGQVIQRIFELKDKVTSPLSKINKSTVEYRRNLKTLKETGRSAFNALKVGVGVFAAASTAVGAFSFSAVKASSDAAEMQSKFETVFASMTRDAENWAKSWQERVGGSRNEIKALMGDSQDMLTGFGATTEQAFELSKMMQTLGTDLASFGNLQGGAAEGVERLRKGLLGEHENLKAMGIIINETVLAQELASRGDQRKLKDLSELEKIELRYAAAVKQSVNAIGDAEKTSDSLTNQTRNLQGRFKDLKAEVGTTLEPFTLQAVSFFGSQLPSLTDNMMPVFERLGNSLSGAFERAEPILTWIIQTGLPKTVEGIAIVVEKATDLYDFFDTNWTKIEPIVWGVVGAYVAFKAVALASATGVGIATAAQWAWNAAMMANPIGLVVFGVGALIGELVRLTIKFGDVKTATKVMWDSMIAGAEWTVNGTITLFEGLFNTINKGFNYFIDASNKYFGTDYKPLAVEFGRVDFSAAKFGAADQWEADRKREKFQDMDFSKWDDEFNMWGDTPPSTPMPVPQGTGPDGLFSDMSKSLANIDDTLSGKGGKGKGLAPQINITVVGSDLTAEQIADKIVPRILEVI